jgi:hypothetical protein
MTPDTQIQERTEEAQLMTPLAESGSVTRDRKDLLLGIYQENRCQARHYETVRATVVSFTLAAAVGISALIAHGDLTRKDWPLAVVLVVIGIYGAIFTSFYFKRISCYEQMAEEFCNELDLLFGTDETGKKPRRLKEIQDCAMTNHKRRFSNWRELDKVDLFRMYWPISISILAAAAMLLKFMVDWII